MMTVTSQAMNQMWVFTPTDKYANSCDIFLSPLKLTVWHLQKMVPEENKMENKYTVLQGQ